MIAFKRIPQYFRYGLLSGLAVFGLSAAEHHGVVKFAGQPVPGATIIATQGDKKLTTLTDPQGGYGFADLADGLWTIQVEMLCFAPLKQEVGITAGAPAAQFELKLLSFDEIKSSAPPPSALPPPTASAPATTASTSAPTPSAQPTPSIVAAQPGKPADNKKGKGKPGATPTTTAQAGNGFQRADLNASANAKPPEATNGAAAPATSEMNQSASDGFLINGSQNNGASSPFALSPAFGNNRRGFRSPYQASLAFILDNSALNARNFSITGQDSPKPATNRIQGVVSFGGPLVIKHIIPASRNNINFFLNYQFARNRNGSTNPYLVPTAAERGGDFSQALNLQGQPVQINDPTTGQPFPNNVIPQNRISPQAQALLKYYPAPNFSSSRYNYQIPLVSVQDQDDFQSRLNKTITNKNQVNGTFNYRRSTGQTPSVFNFQDDSQSSGINTAINWQHRFSQRMFSRFGYNFSRFSNRLTPFFANKTNVSGDAGITGNNQEALNWGPPSLNFNTGILSLTDGNQLFTRNQTHAFSFDTLWNRRSHNLNFGADYKKLQFNQLSQSDPRGVFGFTGASTQAIANGVPVPGTGFDFAGFLLGIPDTSAIAFGNADKYFRTSSYDAYILDDWRVRPGLTLNVGVRWEYSSPVTELYGRLVNLDVTQGFSKVTPVVANNPTGPLTGQKYADSLVNPDKHAFQPRIALAWHPFLASSLTIRAGYGVSYDTSVYMSIANQMAQQSPLSKSLSIANSALNPLTLANGFNAPPNILTNTFGIDPNYRLGYAQNWQVSVQRDLPGALIMTATYLGIKGTRAGQQFLPNTYPGTVNPCPSCPSGFKYLTSNGNSTREAGTLQLRRRLHNGFTASIQYTLSKAIDDASLGSIGQGSNAIAQDWRNLSGERGLSYFDAHHTMNVQMQYSTGVGKAGGALLSGWKGRAFKEWTLATQINVSSGLPLTPIFGQIVAGTGLNSSIRPNYTGLSVHDAPPGLFLNPLAYTAPAAGEWGNAGRDSIIGPGQFSLNASLGRSFQMGDRRNLDLRFDSTNALNHVTYPNWNTFVTSQQFGLPSSANQMRSIRANIRMRF